MNRLFWIFGILLLIGSLVGASFAFNQSPASRNAEAAPVGPPTVYAIGNVDGEIGVSKLYPIQPGKLVKALGEGVQVKKDEPILWLDDEFAKFKVAEAEEDLKNSKALLEQSATLGPAHQNKIIQQQAAIDGAKLARKSANNKLESELAKIKQELVVNKNLLDSYRQEVEQFDERIKAEESKLIELKLYNPELDKRRAEADVASKKIRVEQAQWAARQCLLVAPSDGTVLRVYVNPGEVLGANPQRPAVEFLPNGPLVVRGEILQEWAGRVKLDQEVEIEDDVFQGPKWKGKITFLSPWFTQKRNLIIEPFMYNDVRYLECIVRIDGDTPLRVGQRVRVKIKSS